MQWADWVWRGVAAWDKGEGSRLPVLGRMRHQCEFIVWGSNGPMPAGTDAIPGCVRQSVLQSDKHHQAGKPTQVMRWLARLCRLGGTVLDPFCGSGTTGVGALLEGRSFLGCERVPEHAEVARRRLRALAPSPGDLRATSGART